MYAYTNASAHCDPPQQIRLLCLSYSGTFDTLHHDDHTVHAYGHNLTNARGLYAPPSITMRKFLKRWRRVASGLVNLTKCQWRSIIRHVRCYGHYDTDFIFRSLAFGSAERPGMFFHVGLHWQPDKLFGVILLGSKLGCCIFCIKQLNAERTLLDMRLTLGIVFYGLYSVCELRSTPPNLNSNAGNYKRRSTAQFVFDARLFSGSG